MPYYTFRNTKTNEEQEVFMKISERDEYLKNNPHIVQSITGTPGFADPWRLGRAKIDDGFRDVLKNIKKNNRGADFDIK
jgi:hypothetical protein